MLSSVGCQTLFDILAARRALGVVGKPGVNTFWMVNVVARQYFDRLLILKLTLAHRAQFLLSLSHVGVFLELLRLNSVHAVGVDSPRHLASVGSQYLHKCRDKMMLASPRSIHPNCVDKSGDHFFHRIHGTTYRSCLYSLAAQALPRGL